MSAASQRGGSEKFRKVNEYFGNYLGRKSSALSHLIIFNYYAYGGAKILPLCTYDRGIGNILDFFQSEQILLDTTWAERALPYITF